MLQRQKAKIVTDRVGLDIGSHSITGVEVVQHGSEIVVRSAGSLAMPGAKGKQDVPDNGMVVQGIKNLWSSARFASKRVVMALPPEAVYTKWLHLEANSEEELDQTARAAAARGAPFPVSNAITDYRILSSRGSASRNVYFLMLVTVSASAVDGLLNTAEAAGLEPIAVDIGAAATLRSFEMQKRTTSPLWSGQPLAHCIIGARSTTIAVVRSNTLEFARTVPVGGNDFTECVVEATGASWAEADKIKSARGSRLSNDGTLMASYNNDEFKIPCENVVGRLAREIQRSMKFFRSQFAEGSYLGMIGAATLSGGGALMRGIDTCLQEQGIEVASIVNPFAGFSVDAEGSEIHDISDKATAYTTAVGLAIGDYMHNDNVKSSSIAA